ncbi:MAG: sulfurtransferase [Deltaproteobacteria bacterium]|nr:sulfurtransferase [Deltaproteobacteria bacterium]
MSSRFAFKNLSAGELKKYIETKKEGDYLIIDVRQPWEYEDGHIAGARLMPLMDLESNIFDLPPDQDIVFYCRSGSRSRAAATLAGELELSSKNLYSLEGGILAWQDRVVPDMPKIQLLDKSRPLTELLFTSMDLEKGAYRFYRHILRKFSSESFSEAIQHLANAETAHARVIYNILAQAGKEMQPFEELFASLDGEILEGGATLAEVLNTLEAVAEDQCLRLLEMALDIEYSAFDLYRTVAEEVDNRETRAAFLKIAQAEKEHMRSIARALAECPQPNPNAL